MLYNSIFTLNMMDKLLEWNMGNIHLNSLVIVVSPHPDDETISMGGSIAKLVSNGFNVFIVFVTTELLDITKETDPIIRKTEAIKAVKLLGITNNDHIFFLDFPDGNLKTYVLDYEESVSRVQNIVKQIEEKAKVIGSTNYTMILTSSRLDAHRDHYETYHLVKNALRKVIILEFPTINHISSEFNTNCIIDISDFKNVKNTALLEYNNQIVKQRIRLDEIELWDRWIGKAINVKYAEACFVTWFGMINIDLKIQ